MKTRRRWCGRFGGVRDFRYPPPYLRLKVRSIRDIAAYFAARNDLFSPHFRKLKVWLPFSHSKDWAGILCRRLSVETEPWMRGTHGELDPLRAVVHALELAEEDAERWCAGLGDPAMFAAPQGLPPVALHLRHMARSLDRLLTYAERRNLTEVQLAALETEMSPGSAAEVLREFHAGLRDAEARVAAFDPRSYGEARGIGRKQLPTTVAGLLIHCAEHTQRHAGQMVLTAKLVGALGLGV